MNLMKTEDLIAEISELPIDQRAKIADLILQTLHRPDPEIEKAWAEEAKRRLHEFEKGEVKSIPGKKVFESIRKRLSES
jgi:putative addiction module component (TIGR02574 family)